MNGKNLGKDFVIVIFIILFGKILGFARELVVAYLYGATYVSDAFYYVNSLIYAAQVIITVGLSQAFMPIYLDIEIKENKRNANIFANKISTIMLVLGTLVSFMFFSYPSFFINMLAPELNVSTSKLAYKMLNIMSPSIIAFIAFSIRTNILNAHQRYYITQASGIPYSVSIAVISVVFFNKLGNLALPIAALLGVLFQLLYLLIFSIKEYKFKPIFLNLFDSNVTKYLYMLIPIFISSLLEEANGLLRKALAGGLGNGAIANLNYCMTLTSLINGVVISSLLTVYYPNLIECFSKGNIIEYKKKTGESITLILFLLFPIVTLLFIYSNELVFFVYQRGAFTPNDTLIVSELFKIHTFGFVVYALRCIIKNAFFSTKNAKIPMINESLCLIICMISNFILVKKIGLGINSLAISWIISICFSTPFLFVKFKNKYFSLFTKDMIKEILKIIISTLIMAIIILFYKKLNNLSEIFNLISSFIIGMFVYFILLLIQKNKESFAILNIFRKAIKR